MVQIRHKRTGQVLMQVEAENLVRADLRKASLQGADLCGADLRGADLAGPNLKSANLRGARLQNANLRHVRYDHTTRWPWFFRIPYSTGRLHPWWKFWNL